MENLIENNLDIVEPTEKILQPRKYCKWCKLFKTYWSFCIFLDDETVKLNENCNLCTERRTKNGSNMKPCSACRTWIDLEKFKKDNSDGYYSTCKLCRNVRKERIKKMRAGLEYKKERDEVIPLKWLFLA